MRTRYIALCEYLKLEYGIIVRDRSNDFLCENCLRITVGTPAQNRFLIKTLITI